MVLHPVKIFFVGSSQRASDATLHRSELTVEFSLNAVKVFDSRIAKIFFICFVLTFLPSTTINILCYGICNSLSEITVKSVTTGHALICGAGRWEQ